MQQADNGNTEHAVVASRLTDTDALFEGLLRIQDIRIDTTRYPLAPGADAFGLRVRYRTLSQTRPTPKKR